MIVDGNEIEVLKKQIKNLHLYILPDGKIRVTAPIRMTSKELEDFIHSKFAWIEEKKKVMAKMHEPPRLDDIESVTLWGKKYSLVFNKTENNYGARLNGDCVIFNLKRSFNGEEKKLLIELWQKEKLKEEIPPLIQKWQKILGVTANEMTIKKMKTRWGSCNVKVHRVCFNLQLAEKPLNCLDYVVAHELCHLRIADHSPAFKALMTSILPDWRQTQIELNEPNKN